MFLDRMIAGFWDIVIVFLIFSSLISSKSQSFAFQKDIQISSVCARKSFQQRSVFSGWKSLRKFVSSLEQQRMRAWTCHGRSQKQLVDNLASAGIIKSQIVKDVMIKVDRMNYVLPSSSSNAYDDTPLSNGHGQTISAPHMHAHVLEELIEPLIIHASQKPGEALSILDVGFGSGYLTSCFGRILSSNGNDKDSRTLFGKVWGIEYVDSLVELAKENTEKKDKDLLETGIVDLRKGNGWEGLKEGAPYNAIHVGAAADKFPKNLMMQLAQGGVMVIPVGSQLGGQALYRVERVKVSSEFDRSDYVLTQLLGVRYVPLVHGNYKDMKP